MNSQTHRRSKRWILLAVVALVVFSIAGFAAYRFAIRKVETTIMAALGPRAEVSALSVGLTSIEIAGLRVRAPQAAGKEGAWPAEDELRAERIVVVPSVLDLLRLRVVLNSIRIEGAYVSLLRTKEGILKAAPRREEPEPSPIGPATPDSVAGAGQSAAAPPPATPVLIRSIELLNGSLDFFDATIRKTPVKQRLEQINAHIGEIRLPELTGQSTIRLDAIHKGVRQDGKVSIEGTIELATRESGITTILRDVDMVSLQPYLMKAREAGVSKGSLDFEVNSSIKKGMLYAPGSLALSDLELAPSSATIMGIPRKLAVKMMKSKKGKISVNFVLTGDINDPAFSLNENLSTRIAASIASKLGVDIEGLAKGIGGIGSKKK
jgi:hypothetical protein